jgi:uncharacterized membrane protein YkoI
MIHSRLFVMLLAVSSVLAMAVPVLADDDEEIDLADVPQKVKDAAVAAVKGIKLTEASVEQEDGKTVYELEGTVDGKEYEIEVDEDGKVLEIEQEDDDDDDDDDD